MKYNIHYDLQSQCVFASIEGEIDLATLKEFVQEVARKTREHNCSRVLNDVRGAVLKLSVLGLLDIPKIMKAAGLNSSTRRALVLSRDFDAYRFFKDISRDNGQRMELFTDVESARRWLEALDG